jgi:pimeloyl-[acyl-carrier protein] synthase
VHRGADGSWIVTRYRDVRHVLSDARFCPFNPAVPAPVDDRRPRFFGRLFHRPAGPPPELTQFHTLKAKWVVSLSPPEHTRVRALIASALTGRRVSEMRPHIQARAERLLDGLAACGSMNVVADYAYPLATMTILELLGVIGGDGQGDSSDSARVREMFTPPPSDDSGEILRIDAYAPTLVASFRAAIAERRRAPRNDLITALVQAGNGNGLSDDELLANIILLAIAGHETTYQFVAGALWHLQRHPHVMAAVRANPDLEAHAVQELLRLACPLQNTVRVAREDTEVGGAMIAKGDVVQVAVATANRDAAQFPNPDALDFARGPNPHVTFGHGIHNCIGAHLARVEATIAIGTLVRRYPDLRIETEGVTWRDDVFLSPRSLRVTF